MLYPAVETMLFPRKCATHGSEDTTRELTLPVPSIPTQKHADSYTLSTGICVSLLNSWRLVGVGATSTACSCLLSKPFEFFEGEAAASTGTGNCLTCWVGEGETPISIAQAVLFPCWSQGCWMAWSQDMSPQPNMPAVAVSGQSASSGLTVTHPSSVGRASLQDLQ